MKLRAVLLVAACSAAFVSPAAAQDAVRVAFANGRVTVIANNATVTEILREWARVGGSTFINAEKISAGERMTLRLENETELRAIEVLLRPFAGYAVAQRQAGSPSASAVGRVVIMPGSRPAAYPVAAATPASAASPASTEQTNRQAQLATFAGPPRPDDDGAVRQMVPPPAQAQNPAGPAAPIGQASPLGSTTTQSGPVFGTTTSSRPGVVIGGQPTQPQRPGGRPIPTPMQPKPGGGGG